MGRNVGKGQLGGRTARTIGRLSAVKVQGLKRPCYFADGGNLYLRVAQGGTKGWMFRFAMHGKTRDMGLGRYPDVSLAKAREIATECRRMLATGIDPIEARKDDRAAAQLEATKSMTFDQCSAAYIAAHEAGWRNSKHRQQWKNTLATYASPVLGNLSVQSIDTGLVMKVIEPLWPAKPETSSRLRGRIEAILDWAKVRGYRAGENPARWRGHLDHLLPAKSRVRKVEHHPALPYADIGTFMAKLRQQTEISARALEFLILTATRTSEALGALWVEIDLEARVWTISGERMKANREHRVPLCYDAVKLLECMQHIRRGDYVFAGAREGRPQSQMALLMLLRRIGFGHITAHGFRSTFRDWAAECTSFPREVAEAALAHAIPDAVEAAYRRGDLFEKRRRLMDQWGTYCAKTGTNDARRAQVPSQSRRLETARK
jgi:integrase